MKRGMYICNVFDKNYCNFERYSFQFVLLLLGFLKLFSDYLRISWSEVFEQENVGMSKAIF